MNRGEEAAWATQRQVWPRSAPLVGLVVTCPVGTIRLVGSVRSERQVATKKGAATHAMVATPTPAAWASSARPGQVRQPRDNLRHIAATHSTPGVKRRRATTTTCSPPRLAPSDFRRASVDARRSTASAPCDPFLMSPPGRLPRHSTPLFQLLDRLFAGALALRPAEP